MYYGYGYQGSPQNDCLDKFLAQQNTHYSAYQFYPQQQYQGYKMASAGVPEYGSPGTFSGRKAMQAPGGNSSLSLGDGSNYSPYSRGYGGYQGSILGQTQAPSYQPQPAYGASYNAGGADLSAQLNIPQAMRRPPSAGRRAHSQPTGYDSGATAGYGGYGAANNSSNNPYMSSYSPQPASYNSYQQPTSYQQPPSYQQPSSYQPANSYQSAGAYGAGGGMGSFGAAGAGAYGSAGAGAYGSYGSYGQQQQPQQQGGHAQGHNHGAYVTSSDAYGSPKGNSYSNPLPVPSYPAAFNPGQKGQFGGKVIVQPPGGKTSINIFG